ncbi:MAG: hypothetical protein M3R17_14205 [Bacteroidota bacterium]|nr:hypothetical protein [Bacteroidota bacterium]
MFQEFRFLPQAIQKATLEGILRLLVYVFSVLIVFVLLFMTERRFPQDLTMIHYILTFTFVATGIASITGARQRVQKTTVLITPEELQCTMTAKTTLKIKLGDISRVQRQSENVIFIYSLNTKKPVLALSNLEKQDEFLAIISRYVTPDQEARIPSGFDLRIRLLQQFLFTALSLAFLFFHSPAVIFTTGILLIGMIGYSLAIFFRFRKELSSPVSLITFGFLLLMIILRMAVLAYVLNLQTNHQLH